MNVVFQNVTAYVPWFSFHWFLIHFTFLTNRSMQIWNDLIHCVSHNHTYNPVSTCNLLLLFYSVNVIGTKKRHIYLTTKICGRWYKRRLRTYSQKNNINLRFSGVRRRKTPILVIPFANTGKIYYNICPSKRAESIKQRA